MVTNNFRKILFGGMLNSSATNPTSGYLTYLKTYSGVKTDFVKDETGSEITVDFGTSDYPYGNIAVVNAFNNIGKNATNSLGKVFIKVGTGNTEATANDYCLDVEESTNLTCDSVSKAFTNALTKTFTATFSNSSSSDITITEMGLFGIFPRQMENSYVWGSPVMLDRTVLSSPITIPAGQSKAITYEIAI